MGYVQAKLQVTARLSNHNSDQDAEDRRRWFDFVFRVRALSNESRFELLEIYIDETGAS